MVESVWGVESPDESPERETRFAQDFAIVQFDEGCGGDPTAPAWRSKIVAPARDPTPILSFDDLMSFADEDGLDSNDLVNVLKCGASTGWARMHLASDYGLIGCCKLSSGGVTRPAFFVLASGTDRFCGIAGDSGSVVYQCNPLADGRPVCASVIGVYTGEGIFGKDRLGVISPAFCIPKSWGVAFTSRCELPAVSVSAAAAATVTTVRTASDASADAAFYH